MVTNSGSGPMVETRVLTLSDNGALDRFQLTEAPCPS